MPKSGKRMSGSASGSVISVETSERMEAEIQDMSDTYDNFVQEWFTELVNEYDDERYTSLDNAMRETEEAIRLASRGAINATPDKVYAAYDYYNKSYGYMSDAIRRVNRVGSDRADSVLGELERFQNVIIRHRDLVNTAYGKAK